MALRSRKQEGIRVRPVRQGDVGALVNLVLEYIDFYERPRPERRQIRWLVQHLLEHPKVGKQLVAYTAGRMVGFVTLYYTFSTLRARRVAIMNDLFVLPEARREGVGTRLFDACLSLVRDRGFAHMEWVTAPDNHVAQAFYERLGAERGDWVQYSI